MSIPTTTPAGETYDQTVNTLGTLQDQLVDMAEGFIRALPNFAIAILILLVTWIVARLAHAAGHVALVIKRLVRVRQGVCLQRLLHRAQHQTLPTARADRTVSTAGEALGC